ncbi:MAG: DUF5009 domain-containing protein [Bryobacteraceae bacterium]
MAVTLSFARRVERGDDKSRLLQHVLRRSTLIFLIGLFLNALPDFDMSALRIPGVLQRIAICYLITSAIVLYLGTRGRIVVTGSLLIFYWILMMQVGAGDLTTEGNFAKYVDGLFLSGHMYSHTKTWDPEGIGSTLPAIVTMMLGIFCGQMLQAKRAMEEKSVWLFLIGNLLIFAGMILATWMPINKMLWTASYALFTGGLAYVVFAGCYWLVDVRKWTRFALPFAIYGKNALAVYVIAGIVPDVLDAIRIGSESLQTAMWRDVFEPLASPANASLLFSLAHVLFYFGVAYWLYRRNWIVRV